MVRSITITDSHGKKTVHNKRQPKNLDLTETYGDNHSHFSVFTSLLLFPYYPNKL